MSVAYKRLGRHGVRVSNLCLGTMNFGWKTSEKDSFRIMDRALELGWANYYGIVNDPAWADTMQTPEFQALLAEAKANNDRQRAIVEAVDAENDFRAEFAKMTSAPSE